LLWSRIYDLIVKSILAGEHHVFSALKKTCLHRTNCFELLGYDVMIDRELKPWLIEVNLSPSLACDSPLDLEIKSALLADTLNLAGIKQFDRKKESENKVRNRVRSYQQRGKLTRNVDNLFAGSRDAGLSGILSLGGLRKTSGQALADMHADDFSQPAN